MATLLPYPTLAGRLGEHLLADGVIAAGDLDHAHTLREETAQSLGALLLKLGMLSEQGLLEAYAQLTGYALAQERDWPEQAVAHDALNEQFLRDACLLPLRLTDDALEIATADPENDYALGGLRMAFNRPVKILLALPSQIARRQDELYSGGRTALEGLVERLDVDAFSSANDIAHLRDLAIDAPIVNLVNLLIEQAIAARASDIHIEPFESRLRVRYRIDGMLRDVDAPPSHSTAAIISRVKLMASMNIAERRLPQDGRIQFRHQGNLIDLRVSAVPTLFGESVVLRVLDRETVEIDLQTLGFHSSVLDGIQQLLELPHGILLVTGPTGSGKTTTLYAALRRLNSPVRKILTVEDPVEYQLDGINQIPVRPQIGLGFAEALRSIVRQDPDVIMIGEMRDLETARIGVQSALTGHLVLSTLHTNDAGSSITRLIDMGVEPFLLTSTVTGVIAQRLVRRLCPACKTPIVPSPALVRTLKLEQLAGHAVEMLFAPGRCHGCDLSGYRGRTVIGELLSMSSPVRSAILDGADGHTLQQISVQSGMTSMSADGLRKAVAGVTTIEEVSRVTAV